MSFLMRCMFITVLITLIGEIGEKIEQTGVSPKRQWVFSGSGPDGTVPSDCRTESRRQDILTHANTRALLNTARTYNLLRHITQHNSRS